MTDALSGAWPTLDPVFANTAAAVVSAILLIGSIEKLRDPGAFEDAVRNYQLLGDKSGRLFARVLPLVEILAGALMLALATRPAGAMLALLLWLSFSLAIGINLRRGRDRIDCGCGGGAHTPLGPGLLWRNAALMLLVVAAMSPVSTRPSVWLDPVAVGFGSAFLLGLYFLVNTVLRHQSYLTDLRQLP